MALQVDQLNVCFFTSDGVVQALSDITFAIEPGGSLVIVGESGSGKTVLAHALLRLLPLNARMNGRVTLGDTVLTELSEAEMRRVRGRSIALIPQSTATALNPVLTIEAQLREIARTRGVMWSAAQAELDDLLSTLGLRFAELRRRYPHQLSGGMQQRIVNAAALLGNPMLVVADEPTFGLDPDVVEGTAALLREIPRRGAALLVITHDLRFAQLLGGRIGLMYGSYLVEIREAQKFFSGPLHPYGQGLLQSLPENGLQEIPGQPASLTALPKGCPFSPRCPVATGVCGVDVPPAVMVSEETHEMVRCASYAAS